MSAAVPPDKQPQPERLISPSTVGLAKPKRFLAGDAREFAEAVISTVPTPLLVLDESLAVTTANDAFYHHFRVSPGDTIGRQIWVLGAGQWNTPSLRRLLSDVLPRNASVVNYELRSEFPDVGQRVMLLNARTVFPSHGQASHVLLVIQDVTAQRNAERDLRELNQQLQRHSEQVSLAYNELEAFSYSVSHDLRAPLRGIEGFSVALLEDYGDKLDSTAKDYLARIRNGTVRMGRLIDDLLQLSRLSRSAMVPTEVDLRADAEAIVAELQRTDPNAQVEVSLPEQAIAIGDRQLLAIVMTNLISNAWKFTRKTPHPRIEFGIQNNGGHQVFFVRDNGIGFDPQYAEKIFQPFNRLHSVGEFPGSGIGLAIVHRIIRRHHGLIWATSAPNRGATFFFTLSQEEHS